MTQQCEITCKLIQINSKLLKNLPHFWNQLKICLLDSKFILQKNDSEWITILDINLSEIMRWKLYEFMTCEFPKCRHKTTKICNFHILAIVIKSCYIALKCVNLRLKILKDYEQPKHNCMEIKCVYIMQFKLEIRHYNLLIGCRLLSWKWNNWLVSCHNVGNTKHKNVCSIYVRQIN